MNESRIIAFYLPQFHPISENDEWWGKGFTEWTNVGKAKRFFPGHYQPRVPADLGYYDLRQNETRVAQAALAQEFGIYGFCYWHYWFSKDKKLLQRPFNEVLESKSPTFPFCLAWANENWYAKLWSKDIRNDRLLIEQTYKGVDEYTAHFYDVLTAFKDDRYIKINGKPVFMIYRPLANTEINVFIKTWRNLAIKEKINGIFFVGHCLNDSNNLSLYKEMDFDAINILDMNGFSTHTNWLYLCLKKISRKIFRLPFIVSYNKVVKYLNVECRKDNTLIPSILTGWDHTPRSGINGTVMVNYTPSSFYRHLKETFQLVNQHNHKLVFLKSWNEWAEGNYLEPDIKHGQSYLMQIKKVCEGS